MNKSRGARAPRKRTPPRRRGAGAASTLAPEVLRRLRRSYGRAATELCFATPFELLAATILSAQCTDQRVNRVTPGLFARFPNPQALAAASQEEVEQLVHSTGFFRNKAKSLIGMAQGLVARHKGDVPKDLAALVELPGVARKTANLVLGLAFGITSGVVVDTHVTRLSGLLGLSAEQDAAAIERDLMSLVPERDWIDIGSLLILHGRRVCVARRPKCGECTLADLCPSAEAAAG